MKIAGGLKEEDIAIGNVFDKYGSRNPIVRYLMKGFSDSLSGLVQIAAPTSIHEVGCGEGYWTSQWSRAGIATRGSDFSSQVIDIARANAEGIDPNIFSVKSIYDLKAPEDSADLIVCCEVLEHLDRPEEALRVLKAITVNHLIVSVPREPLWRVLNMARGKYLSSLGNTEGHVQHWSKSGLVELVSRHFDVVAVRTPIPWTMLLCRAKAVPASAAK